MRWRVRAGYPVAVVYLVLADPKPRGILIGAFVAAIGLLIRGTSSGHLRKDRELATSGPYAHTRNPLYLGSAFLAAGFAIAGDSWWAGLLVVAYFGIFYYAVMRNEEEDLHRRFGAAFDAYAARVPLFFPWFARADASSFGSESGEQQFSWAQYLHNREYKALMGTLAGLCVLFLRMWIRLLFGY
jgi:Phospholipid methyltransferase